MRRVKRKAVGTFDVTDQAGQRQIVRVYEEVVVDGSPASEEPQPEGIRYYIAQNGRFLSQLEPGKFCYNNDPNVVLISDGSH